MRPYGVSLKELEPRLREHHADIDKHRIKLNVSFDQKWQGYLVEFAKVNEKSEIFIRQEDADNVCRAWNAITWASNT
jgi:hypothetical protein